MVSLTNQIKVTIIRNAAGIATNSVDAGCKPKAGSYPAAANINLKSPSGCGSNTRDLYDPSKGSNVRQIMNFYGAPATNFVPYDRYNLEDELSLNCELKHGDHLVVIWAPIAQLRKELIRV
jgi:hypothetical protein